MKVALSVCAAVLAACALCACRGTRAPTQMVVFVTSDWDGFERLTITVDGFEPAEPVDVDLKGHKLPRRLVLVDDGGPLGPIAVTVRAFVAGESEPALTEARTNLFFQTGKALLLTIELPHACVGYACDDNEACVAVPGPKCVDADAASKLVPFSSNPHTHAASPGSDAGEIKEPGSDGGTIDAAQRDAALPSDAGNGLDGGNQSSDHDAKIHDDAGASHPTSVFRYVPANFDPDASELAGLERIAVKLDCGNPAFDSSTLEFTNWCGSLPKAIVIDQKDGSDAALIALSSLEIASGTNLQLKGERPVLLAVFGDATIAGAIDASAHGAHPGPGAERDCQEGAGAGGANATSTMTAAGGGGAGFGSPGGGGGDASGTNTRAGAASPGATLAPLRGGCAGGAGGSGSTTSMSSVALGGGGGGALQLSVTGRLHVSGVVSAGGGGGQAGSSGGFGGGGGGSGGAILLEAGTLELDSAAMLAANGGAGGAGQARVLGSTLGKAGEDASAGISVAHGGTAATFAASGGDGAVSGLEAHAGDATALGGGGGGGGGAGQIRVEQAPACTLAARQSPAALVICPSCGTCGVAPGADCARLVYETTRTLYRCDAPLSLQEARTHCQSVGADILSVRDSATNDWLKTQITDTSWIGASDAIQEGSWLWLKDGSLFWSGGASGTPAAGAFAGWGSGEPNNFSGQLFNADCAAIDADGSWHDHQCSETHPYLCE